MVPIGGEFGSPDYDQLMQEDFMARQAKLSDLVARCRQRSSDSREPTDADERRYAASMQATLRELGHDVSLTVAAAVWEERSNALVVSWLSGGETVKSCGAMGY